MDFQHIATGASGTAERGSSGFGRLVVLWIAGCAIVIAVGLNRMYPEPGRRLAYALRDPAMDLTQPFRTCRTAHAAGYFDIPRKSNAYVRWQDEDGDGLACETPPGMSSGRLEIIRKRLAGG